MNNRLTMPFLNQKPYSVVVPAMICKRKIHLRHFFMLLRGVTRVNVVLEQLLNQGGCLQHDIYHHNNGLCHSTIYFIQTLIYL